MSNMRKFINIVESQNRPVSGNVAGANAQDKSLLLNKAKKAIHKIDGADDSYIWEIYDECPTYCKYVNDPRSLMGESPKHKLKKLSELPYNVLKKIVKELEDFARDAEPWERSF